MILFLSIEIVFFTAIGQIFLKKGALVEKNAFINLYVITGYFIFLLVMSKSIFLMNYVSLKYLSLIVSLNYPATIILAALILNEKLSINSMLSAMIVCVGCIIFNL